MNDTGLFITALLVVISYFLGVRRDGGKACQTLCDLLRSEGRLAIEIERLEAELTVLNPSWTKEEAEGSFLRWDIVKNERRRL